jgi:hypothetical protein
MVAKKELTQSPSVLTNPNLVPSAFELVLATEALPLLLLLELVLLVVGAGVIVPVVLVDVLVTTTTLGLVEVTLVVVDFTPVSEAPLHVSRSHRSIGYMLTYHKGMLQIGRDIDSKSKATVFQGKNIVNSP